MLPPVEWITQAAMGAAIGEAVLGKKLGNRAMVWGIVIAWLPHLDYLLAAPLPAWLDLYVVDGLGQSLAVMGVVAFYGGRGLARLWKKQKVTHQEAAIFIAAVWTAYLFREALTVDGAWLLWPIPFGRICFPVLPQVDLLFTLPLVFCLLKLSLLRTKKELPLRKLWLTRGLSLAGAVLGLGLGLKWWAHDGFRVDLGKRGVSVERSMEAPAAWNRLLWRSTIQCGDEIWVGYRSVFEMPGTPVRWTVYPIRTDVLTPVAGEKEIKAALWAADGWKIIRPNKKGLWIGDLRHAEVLDWSTRKTMVDSRTRYSWMLDITRDGNRLRKIEGHADPVEHFQRMGWRIIGNRAQWDGNPRLSGVPGSLPESLMVHE